MTDLTKIKEGLYLTDHIISSGKDQRTISKSHFDYNEQRLVTVSEKLDIPYDVVGHFYSSGENRDLGNGKSMVNQRGMKVTLVFPTKEPMQWTCGQSYRYHKYTIRSFVDGGTTEREVENAYQNASAQQLGVHGRNNVMRGNNYTIRDRGIWNPEYDDEIYNILRGNKEILDWITQCYIKMFPDHEEYFSTTRFHTPTMVDLATTFPGYAMMVKVGWSPTIPFTPKSGFYKRMLLQPNPKRLINYLYGSYSKEFFVHLNEEIMPSRQNWLGLWMIRVGREYFPGQWISRNLKLNIADDDKYTPTWNPVDMTFKKLQAVFGDSKPKRMFEIFCQATESSANAELFFDSINMYHMMQGWNQRRARMHRVVQQRIEEDNREYNGLLADFNVRHLDELHTRVTEQYRELTRRGNYWGNIHSQNYGPQTTLKPDTRLLENLKSRGTVQGIELVVAEKGDIVIEWGEKMEHCIASYIRSASIGATTLIGVYKNKQLVGNASVSGDRITQLRGYRNGLLPAETDAIAREMIEWALNTTPKKKKDEKKKSKEVVLARD